ncbi:MAG: heparinase II/III family protein, partial [Planctomycetes bacterium]|nr:heparinase II/III family protein [Planctomycetota bacterium]
TEGVAYDGYILDFIALWLRDAPAEVRDPIVRHPRFRQFFEESYRLSAPGRAMQVAELSDVEPVGMPFHASAHAKCLSLLPDPLIRWHLDRCDLRELRCDALVDLAESAVKPAARAPAAGATDAHYALVLRSGWDARDLAVAMSCTTSPHHHMHDDDGSIVIGTADTWLICDPGYQQYLGTSERAFTLGAAAHNAPVIDGAAQTAKACRRTALERCGPGIFRAELDLTACYAPEAKLASVTRTVWLAGRDLVVVADRIAGAQVRSLRYHWHAHPDAAWWWEDGAAMIRCAGATAWIRCVGAPLDERDVDRLRGSRGQLTLSKQLEPAVGTHWWVFSIGPRPHAVERDGAQLRVGSRRFALA